jgi:hypothetical protein
MINVQAFDEGYEHILHMADALPDGIVKQFLTSSRNRGLTRIWKAKPNSLARAVRMRDETLAIELGKRTPSNVSTCRAPYRLSASR